MGFEPEKKYIFYHLKYANQATRHIFASAREKQSLLQEHLKLKIQFKPNHQETLLWMLWRNEELKTTHYPQTIVYKSDKHLKMLVLFIALGKIAGFSYGNAAFLTMLIWFWLCIMEITNLKSGIFSGVDKRVKKQ